MDSVVRVPFTMKSELLASVISFIADVYISFDLALPTECDDEYWLTPDGEALFKQPPGKPSKVSGFVYILRLCQGLAFANRTIVSKLTTGKV